MRREVRADHFSALESARFAEKKPSFFQNKSCARST
jgi:hypothetical protein